MSTTLIAGLTAVAAIGAAPLAASAQVQDEQATNIGEVVVTGSRIRRNPTNSPTPLIQIGQEELLQSGEVNVIDFLADIPALSTSVVPEDTTGGNLNDGGLSLLSLRALGAVRTLVLVDGRRHVGSQPGSLAVDVDTIPRLLVANTEVITGGAAAVYGADAVSGVVNFITRKDFDGLEIDGSIAEINQDHQLSERLSVLWGQNLMDGRLNYYVSGEYQRNDEVLDSDVDWRRESWALIGNDADPSSAPSDGIPDQILIRDARTYIRGTNFGGVTILSTGTKPSIASDPDVPFQTCSATTFSANCFSLAPSNRLDNAYLYNDQGVSRPVTFGSIRQGTGFSRTTSNGGEGQVSNTEQGQASRLPESENYRFQTGLNFDITDRVSLFAEAKYVEEETYDAGQRVFHDFNIRNLAANTVGAITSTSAFEIGLDNAYLPADVRQAIANNRRDIFNSAGVVTSTVADARAQHKLYGPARNQQNTRWSARRRRRHRLRQGRQLGSRLHLRRDEQLEPRTGRGRGPLPGCGRRRHRRRGQGSRQAGRNRLPRATDEGQRHRCAGRRDQRGRRADHLLASGRCHRRLLAGPRLRPERLHPGRPGLSAGRRHGDRPEQAARLHGLHLGQAVGLLGRRPDRRVDRL